MIRFNCTYCGSAINVAVTCAGGKARCPSCRRIVLIPTFGQIVDEPGLRALGHAVAEDGGEQDPPPPPPPMTATDTTDEVEIIPPDVNPSMETDILPAEHDDRQDVHYSSRPRQRTRFRQRVIAPRPPKKNHLRTAVLWLAVLLMLIAAAVIIYWRFFRLK